jgi:protein phosphatase
MPALEAVLEDIRGRGIDLIYNLGDLVGKGARSDLAIDRCREVCQHIVRGNWDDGWDEAVVNTPRDPMVDWYYQQLGDERLSFLSTLPNVIDFWLSGKRVRLFHASQESIYKRVYPTDSYEVHRAMFTNTVFTGFDQPEPDIVGYGDIHTTYMRTLLDDHKILFNVGSVGNSLDIPLASYVILTGMFDSREGGAFSIDFIRLSYDIEREIAEAQRLSVPDAEAYAIELRTSVYRGRQKQNTV